MYTFTFPLFIWIIHNESAGEKYIKIQAQPFYNYYNYALINKKYVWAMQNMKYNINYNLSFTMLGYGLRVLLG